MTWNAADRLLREYGLTIPSEAHWEYACRAGSDGEWSVGDEPDGLVEIANLADASHAKTEQGSHRTDAFWTDRDDGFAYLAPVHSMKPNAFGFHHMHGNVWEWVRDRFGPYTVPVSPDGVRRHGDWKDTRQVFRGGSFHLGPMGARASLRWPQGPEYKEPTVGIRPGRDLQR